MKDFYEQSHKAVTGVDWVRYFIEVPEQVTDDMPGLEMLSKVCHKFLTSKRATQQKVEPEMLPSSLSRGSRDFHMSTEGGEHPFTFGEPSEVLKKTILIAD